MLIQYKTPTGDTRYSVKFSTKKIYLHFILQHIFHTKQLVSRDSVVGIATYYGLDGLGMEFRWGARFSSPVQTGPGTNPASYKLDTGSFQTINWPGRGIAHTPSKAEVKE
jgi:hypothetical protein